MTRAMIPSRARTLALALAAALLALVVWGLVGSRPASVNVSAAVGGETITMKVTGMKTGAFKGDDIQRAGQVNVINLSTYHYQLTVPYAPTTGLASGRQQHSPVMVTHLLGANSPQFLNAEATNEILTSVVINFYRVDTRGISVNFYRVTLTNAHLVNDTQSLAGAVVVEDLSFTFQKIQQTQLIVNTTFQDNWAAIA
jgi:type VI secretion system secreted protein Hcp